jgi:hypothetical protein
VLAARYVIAPTELEDFDDGERPLTLLAHQGAAWVYERARPMPVARLVYDYEVVPEDGDAVQRVHDPGFDPRAAVILDTDPGCEIGPAPSAAGTAKINQSSPGFWQITTQSETPAILVLAETAYPGWQVAVEEEVGEMLTAYTTLKAVCVPAGEHEVIWRYAPTVYQIGGLITMAALLLILLAIWRLSVAGRGTD